MSAVRPGEIDKIGGAHTNGQADSAHEIETAIGLSSNRGAEAPNEIEPCPGLPARHIDRTTAELDMYARTWIDLQQTRKALAQRDLPDEIVAEFTKLEGKVARILQRTLRRHDLWPWLSQYPGLGGAHTALVIGRIGDPRRYPGQRCSEGHYLPPLYEVGAPCPVVGNSCESAARAGDGHTNGSAESVHEFDVGIGGPTAGADDEKRESESHHVCPGVMLEPRITTGVRSIWHWAGLHAEDDGRAPRKRKGHQATWEPRVRASIMQPRGIAEQIVRLSVPYYVDIYRDAKGRLLIRVAEKSPVIDAYGGDATTSDAAIDRAFEVSRGVATTVRAADDTGVVEGVPGRPLRLYEADRIARKVAAKAFIGDLLVEWKRLVARCV